MSDTTKSLRPLVNRAPCWESEHEPVITFFTDNGKRTDHDFDRRRPGRNASP